MGGIDPFVQQEKVEKFTYPAPYAEDEKNAFGEPLVNANVFHEDGDQERPRLPVEDLPWIRVRVPQKRGTVNVMADFAQAITTMGAQGFTQKQQISEANRHAFELLVDSWSFSDSPSADEYDRLSLWAGDWVNAALGKAQALGQSREGFGKKTPSSSATQNGSPSESLSETVPAS